MRALRLAVAGVLALGAGTLATFFTAQVLNLQGAPSAAPPAQASVVLTRTAVSAGQLITAADLRLAAWPADTLPAQAHQRIEDVAGRVARHALPEGDLVLEPKLAASDARAGLSATITPGKRAISVRVNDVVGVAGFALPGSYVDVLVSARDGGGQSFARIVLERVRVLAAAQDTQADASRPKVVNAVTLELAPNEAETLDLARAIGNLSLVLRNESDTGRSRSAGIRVADLTAHGSAGDMPNTASVQPAGRSAVPSPITMDTAAPRPATPRPRAAPPMADIAPAGLPDARHTVIEMRGLQTAERSQ